MNGACDEMTAQHGLGNLKEEDEPERPAPPNRHQFQRDLERLHTSIDNHKKKIRTKIDQCLASNPAKEELRNQRNDFTKKLDLMKKASQQMKTALDELKRQQIELEKDCRVRRRDQLEQYLANLEKRYTSANLTIRDEQSLVQEIDALKRNKAKLDKLEEIAKNRKKLEVKIEENRVERNGIFQKVAVIRCSLGGLINNRRTIEGEISQEKSDLNHLFQERKALIGVYSQKRQHYSTWVTRGKAASKPDSVPLTFPSANRHKKQHEEEELEPFYEQKRDCKRLVNYLEQLKSMLPAETTDTPAFLPSQISTDEDSADELPPHLLKALTFKPANPINKKHQLKKSKSSQPISHQIEIYKLFGTVEVAAPQLYTDVPATLELVKEKLSFYEQQTNEIDWNIEELGLGSMPISRTMSDLTDSFYDDSMSETTSISSARKASSRASCQSPLADPQASIDTDEGCSSK